MTLNGGTATTNQTANRHVETHAANATFYDRAAANGTCCRIPLVGGRVVVYKIDEGLSLFEQHCNIYV